MLETYQLLLIGVGGVAILAAVGAFAIAFRRSAGPAPQAWRQAVRKETLEADKSRVLVSVAAPAVEEAPAPAPQAVPPAPQAPPPEPTRPAIEIERAQRVVEVSPEEAGVTRRQFFNRALGATFGAFAVGLGIDILAFLWPKLSGGFGADVNAGNLEELRTQVFTPDGAVVPLFIPEARAYLVPVDETQLSKQFDGRNLATGGLMALFQRCVHLGCRVPWCATSQGFECPCHGSKYNAMGEYFGGPAPRNLDRFVVELTDTGDLIIKTGSIVETPRAPRPSVVYPQGASCIAIEAVES